MPRGDCRFAQGGLGLSVKPEGPAEVRKLYKTLEHLLMTVDKDLITLY